MTDYILYTFPNCPKCSEAKKILEQRRISYEEINAGIDGGRKRFQKFFEENREQIKRDDDGMISLPILFDGFNVMQGLDKIINNL